MRIFCAGIVFFLLVLVGNTSLARADGQTRTYYIAADEVTWNYAPAGINEVTGKPFDAMERPYAVNNAHHIGSSYRKAIYREYTDATFSTLKPRAAADAYLGFVGPIVHAEVGDTIQVVFKNNATRPYSIHPHGVFYEKSAEGMAYNDGSAASGKMGGAVAPGQTYTYVWQVPERAGPGPNDPSSIVWLYHSHVDEQKDVDSGLVGAIVVTARGMANPDGTPKDVDREVVTVYHIVNENQSWYFMDNVSEYTPKLKKAERSESIPLDANGAFTLNGSGFVDGNFKASINGYIYGNGPKITMKQGQRVRWYVIDIGNAFDFHTPHWHGNTVLWNKQRTDVLALMPAQMLTVDMVPDDPGTWLFHCHVADHMDAGMSAFYQVTP
ncbi:MAG TPA: multicopper oxidase domain-containing protein [Candidatus Cybelea sp.]|jgi:FtsP/CotA-like multicopper oxidase with cupredoxin domain|nr:multicopper oxidase domain-containing protein [Candidatus Cybelea sp.]